MDRLHGLGADSVRYVPARLGFPVPVTDDNNNIATNCQIFGIYILFRPLYVRTLGNKIGRVLEDPAFSRVYYARIASLS